MNQELKKITDNLKTETVLVAMSLKKLKLTPAQIQDLEMALLFLTQAVTKVERVSNEVLEDK